MFNRLLSLAALAALLGMGAFRDLYCPECERFSADEWSIDSQGRCRGCERHPVAVEAAARRWTWCESQEEWRDDACASSSLRRCCTEYTATALVNPPADAKLLRAPFCPSCRSFRYFEEGRCGTCGKTAATADAAEITWFWCRADERWDLDPCSMDRGGKCCVPRTVRVPLFFLLPMPRPVSLDEEPGVMVSTDWLAAHLDDLNLVLVQAEFGPEAVDAATRPAFFDGHIPFAHPLDWRWTAVLRDGLPNEFPPAAEMAEAFRRMGVEADSRVVLYDTGAGQEAARAFVALEYLGLSGRVSILDGHWKKWVREGRELSRVYSGVEPSGFVPKLSPGVLLSRREMTDLVWTSMEMVPTAVLLDARAPEEYTGMLPGKGILRPGHLPGAMSLPWTSMIVSRDNPVFRPEAELRALFEAKGARPGRRVAAYCRTGVSAATLYVAARHLGYEAGLYDGSYAEWSGDPRLPVEGCWTLR